MITKNRLSRLTLESLEKREVPAILPVAPPVAGILTVYTDNADTTVTLSQTKIFTIPFVHVGDGTNAWLYPLSSVTKVVGYGGGGSDIFTNNAGNLPVQFHGSHGNNTLIGGAGNDLLVGGDDRDVIQGRGGADVCYGNGGDDTVAGGDGNDWLYGDGGDDQVTGGGGADRMYGGAGYDTLVTIDGVFGNDTVDGGTGATWPGVIEQDTLWTDKIGTNTDSYTNVEKFQFVSSFTNGADLTLNANPSKGVENLIDPTDGTYYKNFETDLRPGPMFGTANPLFGYPGPVADDVDQENLGDCWLLGTLGAVAHDNPLAVRQAVADFGDGTYGVKLGGNFYRVDADLPTWGANSTDQQYAGLGYNNSLWVALVEKAYAHYRYGTNKYSALNGGNPIHVLAAYNATGVVQTYYPPTTASVMPMLNAVVTHFQAHQNVTICVGNPGSPSLGLVGNHCYTVTDAIVVNGVTMIRLRNPWGAPNPYVTLTSTQLLNLLNPNTALPQTWITWGNI